MMDSYQVVMKSLRVKRTTLALTACVPAAVAVNGIILAQLLGRTGLAVGLGLVFGCTLIATSFVLVDVLSRSEQNLSALRSAGARKATTTSVLLVGILGFGVTGALLGTTFGAAIAWSVGEATAGILANSVLVIVASAAAVASGAYIGVGAAWNK